MGTAQIKRQSRPIESDVEDDDALYETRMPSSARRYKSTPPTPEQVAQPKLITRATRVTPVVQAAKPRSAPLPKQDAPSIHGAENNAGGQQEPITQGTPVQRRRASLGPQSSSSVVPVPVSDDVTPITGGLPAQKKFPLVPVLIACVATILLVMVLSALGSWWRVYQDDLHYGRPRTSQMDAVVGHGDSVDHPSHFIFLNLHRHVEIIEIAAGDAAHTHIYTGPILYGDGQDLAPVTGEFRDIHKNGRPELVVHIGDQQIVYANDGTTFHQQ
ncbi:MAG: hypothetical protein PVS3B3_14620 [Ktedonobacteraceae bacterium]